VSEKKVLYGSGKSLGEMLQETQVALGLKAAEEAVEPGTMAFTATPLQVCC
jgi:hypothetical protein